MNQSTSLHAAARGLILGEALSWTGLYQRSLLLPHWTRRKRREMAAQYEQDNLSELSLPFALNQPDAALKPAPGPHSEWFAFQLNLITSNGAYSAEHALEVWSELLAQRSQLRLGIAQHATLENLAQGKRPPITGHDNPHYFDDSACFRALALALHPAVDGSELASLIERDAAISNAEDGIWAAQACGVALAETARARNIDAALAAGCALLPAESWSARVMRSAFAEAGRATTLFDLIGRLARDAVNDAYNYGNTAAETVPIMFAILKFTQGSLHDSLLAALALPRTAGSVAPLVGAFCAVLDPVGTTAAAVCNARLVGLSLPCLQGIDLLGLVDAANGYS